MIKRILGRLLPLALIKDKLGFPSQDNSLKKLKALGFNPARILDIGAYKGHWSLFIHQLFPSAKIMMLEGQSGKEAELVATSGSIPGAEYRIALLGAEKKEVTFNVYETASSVLTEENPTPAIPEKHKLKLLDEVLAGTLFARPAFIKIDCQGYELEILKGGLNALRAAEAVLLEVSFLQVYTDCPLAAEVMVFMKSHGFVLYDICTLMRRPYDKALYQSDFLFVREDSFLRASSRWE